MKTPTVASLKKVTPQNLVRLGADRLAEILIETAQARPELKRRLRMELAAEQGAEHLVLELDKRLTSLEASCGRIAWRRRAGFVRDLDQLRGLITLRLAPLDPAGAAERMWRFLALAPGIELRMRDRDGVLDAVFAEAARDLGPLLAGAAAADDLAGALAANPSGWARWLPELLERGPDGLARRALDELAGQKATTPGWLRVVRTLADAAGDADAFAATFSAQALKSQPVAAEVSRRLLAAGRLQEAYEALEAARPRRAADIDFDWESAGIDLLEARGEGLAAQAARWASFERTLSADRLRDFTRRLADFEDVEAEHRAFAFAAAHSDATQALAFLMDWPALPEAARLIASRADDLAVDPEQAEAWAAKLRFRQPAAALAVLRNAAASAFRRRQYALCDRLTAEAESLAAV